MCDSIFVQKDSKEIETIRQFQEHFKVDAKLYGYDGTDEFLDTCLCNIELEKFFNDQPEYKAIRDNGDWIIPADDMIDNKIVKLT